MAFNRDWRNAAYREGRSVAPRATDEKRRRGVRRDHGALSYAVLDHVAQSKEPQTIRDIVDALHNAVIGGKKLNWAWGEVSRAAMLLSRAGRLRRFKAQAQWSKRLEFHYSPS